MPLVRAHPRVLRSLGHRQQVVQVDRCLRERAGARATTAGKVEAAGVEVERVHRAVGGEKVHVVLLVPLNLLQCRERRSRHHRADGDEGSVLRSRCTRA